MHVHMHVGLHSIITLKFITKALNKQQNCFIYQLVYFPAVFGDEQTFARCQ